MAQAQISPDDLDLSAGVPLDQAAPSDSGQPKSLTPSDLDLSAGQPVGEYVEENKGQIDPVDLVDKDPKLALKLFKEKANQPITLYDSLLGTYQLAKGALFGIPGGIKTLAYGVGGVAKTLGGAAVAKLEGEDPNSPAAVKRRAEASGALSNLQLDLAQQAFGLQHNANRISSIVTHHLVGNRDKELSDEDAMQLLYNEKGLRDLRQMVDEGDVKGAQQWMSGSLTSAPASEVERIPTKEQVDAAGQAGEKYDPERARTMGEALNPEIALPIEAALGGHGVISAAAGGVLKGAGKAIGATGSLLQSPLLRYAVETGSIGAGVLKGHIPEGLIGSWLADRMMPKIATPVGRAVEGAGDFVTAAGEKLTMTPEELADLDQIQRIEKMQPGFLKNQLERRMQQATLGAIGASPFTLSAQDPYEAGATIGGGAAVGSLAGGLNDIAFRSHLLGRSLTHDAFVRSLSTSNRPVQLDTSSYDYGTDSQLDSLHDQATAALGQGATALLNQARHAVQGMRELYVIPEDSFQKAFPDVSANGVDTGDRIILNQKGWQNALMHELGHPIYDSLSPESKAAVDKANLETNDPDSFLTKYLYDLTGKISKTRYEDLPETMTDEEESKAGGDPEKLMTKEKLRAEMAADLFTKFYISQISENPSVRRNIQYAIGKSMESLGIPTTTSEVRSYLGLQPSYRALSVLEAALRDTAIKAKGEGPIYEKPPASPNATAPQTQPKGGVGGEAVHPDLQSMLWAKVSSGDDKIGGAQSDLLAKAHRAIEAGEIKNEGEFSAWLSENGGPQFQPRAEDEYNQPWKYGDKITSPAIKVGDITFRGRNYSEARSAARQFGFKNKDVDAAEEGFISKKGEWLTPDDASDFGVDRGQLPKGAEEGPLTPEQFYRVKRFQPSSDPKAIAAAAIKTDDGKIFAGFTHGDAMANASDALGHWPTDFTEGFIDKQRNFMDRSAGLARAASIGQEAVTADRPPGRYRVIKKLGLNKVVWEPTEETPKDPMGGYMQFQPSSHPDAIVAAAIKTDDGELHAGWSHGVAYAKYLQAHGDRPKSAIEGFVNRRGEFLDRTEAAKVAAKIGQIPESQNERTRKLTTDGVKPGEPWLDSYLLKTKGEGFNYQPDQRLLDHFDEFDDRGFPRVPKTLPDDSPLLRATVDLPHATITPDDQLAKLGVLKPGSYDRLEMRDAILDHFLNGGTLTSTGNGISKTNQPRALFMGGGAGAGKTSVLAASGYPKENAVQINPDDIRELFPESRLIAKAGDGRMADVTQKEAATLADELFRQSVAQRKDVIYDGTMKNPQVWANRIDLANQAGYDTSMIGVLNDEHEAAVRGALRYLDEGRWTDPGFVHQSHQGFQQAIPEYLNHFGKDNVALYDNFGEKPRRMDVDEFLKNGYIPSREQGIQEGDRTAGQNQAGAVSPSSQEARGPEGQGPRPLSEVAPKFAFQPESTPTKLDDALTETNKRPSHPYVAQDDKFITGPGQSWIIKRVALQGFNGIEYKSPDGATHYYDVSDDALSYQPSGNKRLDELKSEWSDINNKLLEYVQKPNDKKALEYYDRLQEICKEIVKTRPTGDAPKTPSNARQVVIIGGGPAGMSAGIMASADGLDNVVLDSQVETGGQSRFSSRIENYPGFPIGATGRDLAREFYNQATRLGSQVRTGARVVGIDYDASTGLKTVRLFDGEEIPAHTVLVASGIKWRKLDFPGADSPDVMYGNGESVGIHARGKPAVIIGGSNGAAQAALGAARNASEVTILSRGPISQGMSEYQIEAIKNNPKINVIEGDQIKRLVTDDKGATTGIETKGGKNIPASAVGIFAGGVPNTEWLPPAIKRTSHGTIEVDGDMQTSIPGVYAAGDAQENGLGRIGAAVGDGQRAERSMFQYLDQVAKQVKVSQDAEAKNAQGQGAPAVRAGDVKAGGPDLPARQEEPAGAERVLPGTSARPEFDPTAVQLGEGEQAVPRYQPTRKLAPDEDLPDHLRDQGAFDKLPPGLESQSAQASIIKLTKDPEFNKWFKGSAVVDDHGLPQPLFHQTFTKNERGILTKGFDLSKANGSETDFQMPPGVFMKPFSEKIPNLGDPRARYGQIPLVADIKKPLLVRDRDEAMGWYHENVPNFQKLVDDYYGLRDKWGREMDHQFGDPDLLSNEEMAEPGKFYEKVVRPSLANQVSLIRAAIADAMKQKGYDGMIMEGDEGKQMTIKTYIALDPNQVKSAVYNHGTFDPKDPRIQFQPAVAETADEAIAASAAPGSERGFNSPSFSYQSLDDLTNHVLNRVAPTGSIMALQKAGIPNRVEPTLGQFHGAQEPSFILRLPESDFAQARHVAAIVGDALLQDAVIPVEYNPEGRQFGLTLEPKGDLINELSPDQIRTFTNWARENDHDFTIWKDGSRILLFDPRMFEEPNYSLKDFNDFTGKFTEIAKRLNLDGTGFRQNSEYISHPDYEKIIDESEFSNGELGSSTLLDTAKRDLYRPAEEEYRKFFSKQGFTPAGRFPSERFQAKTAFLPDEDAFQPEHGYRHLRVLNTPAPPINEADPVVKFLREVRNAYAEDEK